MDIAQCKSELDVIIYTITINRNMNIKYMLLRKWYKKRGNKRSKKRMSYLRRVQKTKIVT
jgi:hypothetical protein